MKTLVKILFLFVFVPYLLIGCFSSCKSVKEVIKTETKYDSTAIKENEALKRVLAEEQERFEKEKQEWEETGVTFYHPDVYDLLYRDTTTLLDKIKEAEKYLSKITFEKGKISTISGPVKSINQSKFTHDLERYEYQKKIDSLTTALSKQKVQVVKQAKEVYKTKKVTVYPWLLFALCLLIGMTTEARFKLLKRIFPFINF